MFINKSKTAFIIAAITAFSALLAYTIFMLMTNQLRYDVDATVPDIKAYVGISLFLALVGMLSVGIGIFFSEDKKNIKVMVLAAFAMIAFVLLLTSASLQQDNLSNPGDTLNLSRVKAIERMSILTPAFAAIGLVTASPLTAK